MHFVEYKLHQKQVQIWIYSPEDQFGEFSTNFARGGNI